MRAGIALERLPRFRELEYLVEFIRTKHDVRFASTIACRNVLDGFSREDNLARLRIGIGDVLVDVPFDVELAEDGASPPNRVRHHEIYLSLRAAQDRYCPNASGFPGGATSNLPLSVPGDACV